MYTCHAAPVSATATLGYLKFVFPVTTDDVPVGELVPPVAEAPAPKDVAVPPLLIN